MRTLRAFATALALQPAAILILLVAAWVCWPRRWARRLLLAGIVLSYASSIAPVENLLARGLQAPFPHVQDAAALQGVDVIVVLAGAVSPRAPERPLGLLRGEAATRLAEARRLFESVGRRVPIVISGGPDPEADSGSASSAIMRDWLLTWNVPPSLVVTEERSRDTFESAMAVKTISDACGWRRPALVTSAWHLRRSLLAFRAAGLSAVPVPADMLGEHPLGLRAWVPAADVGKSVRTLLREYLGLGIYAVQAWMAAGVAGARG